MDAVSFMRVRSDSTVVEALLLLEVSYLLAQWLRHGTAYYREAPLYRNVFFTIAAIDLVVGLMMGSYRGILRRGYWLGAKAVAKHAIIVG